MSDHCNTCKASLDVEGCGWFCEIYGLNRLDIENCDLSEKTVETILEYGKRTRVEAMESILSMIRERMSSNFL
jgi:hypothetical protein